MLWFEEGRIPEGQWPFLNVVRANLCEIEESLVDRLDLTEGTGELLITGCMQAYKQAVMRRVLDLAQASVVSWNAGMLIGSVVCSRALLETIATFHSFQTRAQKAATSQDWESIGKLVDAYAFSTMSGPKKKERIPERPPGIKEIVVDFIKATQPNKEQFWEQICDIAHPNGDRMTSLGGRLQAKRYDFRMSSENELMFVAVFNCLYSCTWLASSELDFNILLGQIRGGGELPPEHELIATRNLIDKVTAMISKEIGPMCTGMKKKGRVHRKSS